jgi:hypothetical protein
MMSENYWLKLARLESEMLIKTQEHYDRSL